MPADIHLSFALPPPLTPMVEYLVRWNVIHQWFLAHPVHPVDGVLTPPTRPGLGRDLDENKIEGRRELTFA